MKLFRFIILLGNFMRWEYQLLTAETGEAFQSVLNRAGADGWEAVFGGFAVGASSKISLGQGMPLMTKAGVPAWTAVMKRTCHVA
jgi:hypothetical protein